MSRWLVVSSFFIKSASVGGFRTTFSFFVSIATFRSKDASCCVSEAVVVWGVVVVVALVVDAVVVVVVTVVHCNLFQKPLSEGSPLG